MLTPVISGYNHKTQSGSTFWAAVDVWWHNTATSVTGPTLYVYINSYCKQVKTQCLFILMALSN